LSAEAGLGSVKIGRGVMLERTSSNALQSPSYHLKTGVGGIQVQAQKNGEGV
jgi:hypothetical protein